MVSPDLQMTILRQIVQQLDDLHIEALRTRLTARLPPRPLQQRPPSVLRSSPPPATPPSNLEDVFSDEDDDDDHTPEPPRDVPRNPPSNNDSRSTPSSDATPAPFERMELRDKPRVDYSIYYKDDSDDSDY